MIVVVTLNPALDVTHYVEGADWAGVNRPHEVHVRAGGKGINVARTLCALGQQVTVTGMAGGCNGRALVAGLDGAGMTVGLTPIAAETRRTFLVADSAREQTALFNEPGPAVSGEEYRAFAAAFEQALPGANAVILTGSLPPGVPEDAYASLIASAARGGVPVILDASGPPLRLGAAAGPAMIKPNLAELETVAGRELKNGGEPDLPAIERAARELAASAAVVVSLGAAGLLAVAAEGTWHARPPGHVAGNPTGAGDAVVAGLADSLVRGHDWPAILRHAVALGSATAAAPVAGDFAAADYERLVTAVEITGGPSGDGGDR